MERYYGELVCGLFCSSYRKIDTYDFYLCQNFVFFKVPLNLEENVLQATKINFVEYIIFDLFFNFWEIY